MQSLASTSDYKNNPEIGEAGIFAIKKWEEETGITPTTTWRWRRKGWIDTVNICGRVYITAEAIAAFKQRAQAGEFAKEHVAPKRAKGGSK